jgi:predicted metal-binding membrane protein
MRSGPSTSHDAADSRTEITLPVVEDTPRSAYSVLERRATLTTVSVLLGLAGVSWWSTLGNVRDMSSMVQGFAHVGRAMPFDTSVTVFMVMWLTMMVAMMFPTIAPIVLLHRMVLRRRGEGLVPTVAFGSGYLVIWAVVGIVPLAGLIGFRHLAAGSSWVPRAGGVVLLFAGMYQFTPWKEACLRACRTPLSFLMTHDFGGGSVGALRVGLSHGLYCLGCCWALMAVLFVVGLMNLAWMAAIAVVFLAEKNWRHGVGLTKVAGAAVVLFGAAVLIHPSLLSSVAPLTHGATMMIGG